MIYRIIAFLVEVFCWILIFASPMLIFGIIGLLIYFKNLDNLIWSVILLAIGTLAGTILAEWARRTYGCANFFGSITGGEIEKLRK